MIKTTAIRNVNKEALTVIWDTGRRCNYDCTYCEATRHNNHSRHATLDEFKKTFNFIKDWNTAYNTRRLSPAEASINFTGGEPTVNPNFWKFITYIKCQPESYSLSLTTNGAWSNKNSKKIIENFNAVTISYHAEAADSLKKQVVDRIEQISTFGPENNCSVSINVMFHAAYFEECKKLCEYFNTKNIKYVPRVIGEEPDSRSAFAHQYTEEQLQWMKDYWNMNTKQVNSNG
jgi:MoaA/NifB/PqqE/SkfB family radical SAM enzyme